MLLNSNIFKPDFAVQRRHFIFNDEHEQLRDSIRRFVVKARVSYAAAYYDPANRFSASEGCRTFESGPRFMGGKQKEVPRLCQPWWKSHWCRGFFGISWRNDLA